MVALCNYFFFKVDDLNKQGDYQILHFYEREKSLLFHFFKPDESYKHKIWFNQWDSRQTQPYLWELWITALWKVNKHITETVKQNRRQNMNLNDNSWIKMFLNSHLLMLSARLGITKILWLLFIVTLRR